MTGVGKKVHRIRLLCSASADPAASPGYTRGPSWSRTLLWGKNVDPPPTASACYALHPMTGGPPSDGNCNMSAPLAFAEDYCAQISYPTFRAIGGVSLSWQHPYNVYSRKNPYFIYFALESPEGEDGSIQQGNLTPKAYQVSIFPILPSITWNFNF